MMINVRSVYLGLCLDATERTVAGRVTRDADSSPEISRVELTTAKQNGTVKPGSVITTPSAVTSEGSLVASLKALTLTDIMSV